MNTKTTSNSAPAKDVKPSESSANPHAKSSRFWLQKLFSAALLFGVGIAVIAAMGLAQRMGWISAGGGGGAVASEAKAGEVYTCPMHPQIRQPSPGTCPICGMTLVISASGSGADADELAIKVEPAARRLANIQTEKVKREAITTTIETIGAIAIDESRIVTIASYIDGRIERLFADYTGIVVEKDDHLAVVYSPELYSAQVEYLESRKVLTERESSLPSVRNALEKLAANSRQKLVELGMKKEQITELEETGDAKSRLTIYATAGGTVTEKLAFEGKYINTGEPIYRIADLSTVWLMLELYPEDASRIRFGQRVEAVMQSIPGQVFEGRVAFIDPTVHAKDRTVGVRVEFFNKEGLLRPGDYASAKIFLPIGQTGEVFDADLAGRWISPMHPQIVRDEPGECPICKMDLVPTSRYGYSDTPVKQPLSTYVPRNAVLMAGANSVAYVETEPGRFEIRALTLGPILKHRVIIHSGLKEGEEIATAGNFLIDSQMQLEGKPSLIDPTRAIIAQKTRKKPLEFADDIQVEIVSGKTGEQLQKLYATYFAIQEGLTKDQKPTEENAKALFKVATELADAEDLPESAREEIKVIIKKSEHLHHMKIDKARLDAFRPISQSVVKLAAQVRGDNTKKPFSQMFCPMVKGGGGDWLQQTDKLQNPYFGTKMQTCGDVVRELPVKAEQETKVIKQK